MLLERFGLWEVRGERVGSFSRGMLQRLALCRALLHEPDLLVLDEPFSALDAEGAELLDRQLAELAGAATLLVATHDPARLEPLATARLALGMTLPRRRRRARAQGPAARAAGARHAAGDAALRRLGARRLPLRAARPAADELAAHGLLWVALVFTALLGLARALAPEREQRRARRARARAVRPQRDLARQVARGASSSSRRSSSSRCPRSRSSSRARRRRGRRRRCSPNVGICAVGTLLAAMAVAGRARELVLPLLFLPLAIPLVVGGVGASVGRRSGPLPRLSSRCTTRVFAILCLGVL